MADYKFTMRPEDFGLKEYVILEEGEQTKYYIYQKTFDPKKGTFLYLQGSGPIPICIEDNGEHRLIFSFHLYPEITDRFNFIIIGKPGIGFSCGDVDDKIYHSCLSLDYRVEQANRVLEDYLSYKPQRGPVLVCGHSEGAHVAIELAILNNSISHLVLLSGGGASSQYYDYILELRKRISKNEILFADGEKQIENFLKKFEEIQADRYATDKFWKGHTYLRWSSFSIPKINSLKKINIPIFFASGANDTVFHLETLDLILTEFILLNKRNFTSKIFEHCDHSFKNNDISYIPYLIRNFTVWYEKSIN